MTSVKDISIEEFDYPLPDEKIALHPLDKRDECKLLVYSSRHPKIYHRKFKELPDLLPPGALMVCNDTKVINARLTFHKETGASIELFLLEPVQPSDYALNFQSKETCEWKCLVGNSKKWKDGSINAEITVNDKKLRVFATRLQTESDGTSTVAFSWSDKEISFARIIERAGKIPIPPYLNRDSEASDLNDYQTVFAKVKGSVAAPTAGLHFTPQVFENLRAHAVEVEEVTLHVGAGTFKPVKEKFIGDHPMHSEPFTVSRKLIEKLIEWKEKGLPVVAVGTTSVRTLESIPYIGIKIRDNAQNPFIVNQWDPYDSEEKDFDTIEALKSLKQKLDDEEADSFTASTSIMIAPGFKWRITEGLVTNFHQPKSTLLLLVSSFSGGDLWKNIYEEALQKNYRFLSYGDACLFIR